MLSVGDAPFMHVESQLMPYGEGIVGWCKSSGAKLQFSLHSSFSERILGYDDVVEDAVV